MQTPHRVPHSHAIVYFRHSHTLCNKLIFGTVVKIPANRDPGKVITNAKKVLADRLLDGLVSFKPFLSDLVLKQIHTNELLEEKYWLPEVVMEGGYTIRHARATMAEQFIAKERDGLLVINRKHYATYSQK